MAGCNINKKTFIEDLEKRLRLQNGSEKSISNDDVKTSDKIDNYIDSFINWSKQFSRKKPKPIKSTKHTTDSDTKHSGIHNLNDCIKYLGLEEHSVELITNCYSSEVDEVVKSALSYKWDSIYSDKYTIVFVDTKNNVMLELWRCNYPYSYCSSGYFTSNGRRNTIWNKKFPSIQTIYKVRLLEKSLTENFNEDNLLRNALEILTENTKTENIKSEPTSKSKILEKNIQEISDVEFNQLYEKLL